MVNGSEKKDEIAVAGLLESLPRVEAPGDFDLRVRARIAAGRPKRTPWFPAAVRVAVPLGLVLSVGGYVGYRAVYQPVSTNSDVGLSKTSDTGLVPPATIEVAVSNNSLPDTSGDGGNGKPTVKLPPNDDKTLTSAKTNMDPKSDTSGNERRPVGNPRGGSFDAAVKESKTIYPRGINPNSRISVRSKDLDRLGVISAKDVITQFGVEVIYAGSELKVISVKENSPAQHAGLKSGDIVEAINDQPIRENTMFRGRFSGKSIRLKRDGATVTIDLSKKR